MRTLLKHPQRINLDPFLLSASCFLLFRSVFSVFFRGQWSLLFLFLLCLSSVRFFALLTGNGLQEHIKFAPDRFSDESRPGDARTRAPREVAKRRTLRANPGPARG